MNSLLQQIKSAIRSRRFIVAAVAGSLFLTSLSYAPVLAQDGYTQAYMIGKQKVSLELGKQFIEAFKLFDTSNYDESSKRIDALLAKDPGIAGFHYLRGAIMEKRNRPADAYEEAKKAIKIDPTYPIPYPLLGNSCLLMGKLEESKQAFLTYLKLAPNEPNCKQVRDIIKEIEKEMKTAQELYPSPPGTYVGRITSNGVVHWASEKMPVKVYIAPGEGVPGYKPEYLTVLHKCFSEWEAAANGAVKFQFVNQSVGSHIEVIWTNDSTRLVNPSEGGHTLFQASTKGIEHAETILLTQIPGSRVNENSMHIVGLHEIGHALGINGHSDNSDDIMFLGFQLDNATDRNLSDRDAKTLVALYGMPSTGFKKGGDNKDLQKMVRSSNPINKAMAMNNEAGTLLEKGQYSAAIAKFREALALAPDLDLVSDNLRIALTKYASDLITGQQFEEAAPVLKELIEREEKAADINRLLRSLKAYKRVLDTLGRKAEADSTNQRINALSLQQTRTEIQSGTSLPR